MKGFKEELRNFVGDLNTKLNQTQDYEIISILNKLPEEIDKSYFYRNYTDFYTIYFYGVKNLILSIPDVKEKVNSLSKGNGLSWLINLTISSDKTLYTQYPSLNFLLSELAKIFYYRETAKYKLLSDAFYNNPENEYKHLIDAMINVKDVVTITSFDNIRESNSGYTSNTVKLEVNTKNFINRTLPDVTIEDEFILLTKTIDFSEILRVISLLYKFAK